MDGDGPGSAPAGTDSSDPRQRKLLALALARFPDPVVMLQPIPGQPGAESGDARITWANDAAAAVLDVPTNKLSDRLLSNSLSPLGDARLAQLIAEVAASGEPGKRDDFVTAPGPGDSHADVHDVRALPLGAEVCLTWRRTTAKRIVAAEQAEADALYGLMAAASPELVYRTDAHRVVRWVSPNCACVVGWTAADLYGHQMVALIHPDDRANLDHDLAELYAGRALTMGDQPVVLRMRTKDRGYRWMAVRSRSVVDREGHPDGLIVGMLDVNDPIAAQLAAETAQREAERTLMSMDAAAIGLTITGLDGRFKFVNTALCQMLGYPREELQGRTFADITHPEDRAPGLAALADLVAGRTDHFSQRKRYLTKDGQEVWVDVAIGVVRDADGAPIHFVNQVMDVTAEVRNSQALQRSVQQFRLLAENASDIVYQTDRLGSICWVSPSVSVVLGWDPGLLVGTMAMSLVAPQDLPEVMRVRDAVYATGQPGHVICRFRTTTGSYRFMSVTATATSEDGGAPSGAIVTCRDVTEERRALADLQAREEQFRIGMQYAPTGMAIAERSGRILQVNPALCRLLERHEPDLVGHRLDDLVPADVSVEVAAQTSRLAAGELQGVRQEHRMVVGDNEIWVDHSISLMPGDQSRPPLFIHQLADQTAARMLQSELTFRANHDVLTGLFNRANLMARLADRLTARSGPVGVLFVDVDALKPINDSYGHAAGDAAIVAVADRMVHSLRRQDLVARLGGDEFVAVIDHCESVAALMATCEHLLAACSRPIRSGSAEIPLTVSLGAVLAHPGDNPEDLLVRADRAMYRAKGAGGNRAVGEM